MKKLFNIDVHISVILDIKNILNELFSNIEITNWSLSGHNWVLNKNSDKVEFLNNNTWVYLNDDIIKNFQDKYDDFLITFDGFIVCHPNSFILLFEKYNKPIYVINTCRYDLPFCWNNNHEMIEKLHRCLIRLQNKNLLRVISNNLADNKYFLLGNPTINTKIIQSLCTYTEMLWKPLEVNNKFLLYNYYYPQGFIKNNKVINKEEYGKFEWKDLMKFSAIIHFPYEASTMSIFEHISSLIPIFFPSKHFLKYLITNNYVEYISNYWRHRPNCVLPEYLKDTLNLEFWLDNADFYNIKGYYYFNSFEELNKLINNFEDNLYTERKDFVNKRKKYIFESYKECFKELFK